VSPEIRIGDAEREAAVAALGEHYAAGRLTKEEYDERAERAWAARVSSTLTPLFADLPAPHWNRPTMASTMASAPSSRRPAGSPRRAGFHLPLLPMLAIFVGVALLVGHFWVFWVLLGLYWWAGRSFRQARRREWRTRYGDVPGWVQDWHRQGRSHHRGC
jgi:hypothetical protein